MENVTDYPQNTNSSLADSATASASAASSEGSTVSQLQPVSGSGILSNEPVDSRAAVQEMQYNPGSPEAVTASQVNPKRKWGSNDASSVHVADRGDEQGTVIQDVPACSEAIPSTDSNTDDDSPTGPEDPDWDMWIKEPSTGKDGPSAKETLIAGKLDWETPVQWSGVTAEEQAQAILRLRFWMGWTREKAEAHLKKIAGKWFSEKKRHCPVLLGVLSYGGYYFILLKGLR
ncbi:hypothetical protein BZA77DRAFT_294986 [Pyronema omphalodes]|nr:hypothetical protein BZA77DRAFT_294986 [Pyronema omphalodes]